MEYEAEQQDHSDLEQILVWSPAAKMQGIGYPEIPT
jgi:hypothetical protein